MKNSKDYFIDCPLVWRGHVSYNQSGSPGLQKRPLFYVVFSALLFGISTPLSKLLIRDISPVGLAGLLYLGAFLGLTVYSLAAKIFRQKNEVQDPPLDKRDIGWLAGAIIAGGILAPISLLFGLSKISGYSASLLFNLEGAATALIAVFIFKENAGRLIWLALASMTLAGVFLSWDPGQGRFALSGSLLILLSMACWGIDNNFTRNISDKNPIQIAKIKGIVAGSFSILLALALGMKIPVDRALFWGLLLGALSYGLSLVFYIKGLGGLGAFRAGAFFSFAPFVGALASLLILREPVGWIFLPGTILMVLGVALVINEKHEHYHRHEKSTHTHAHDHRDGHHGHNHSGNIREPHSHEHTHEETDHIHDHWPDIHHRHGH
jgi:drug/metabolite transporter (DMT)-like permease